MSLESDLSNESIQIKGEMKMNCPECGKEMTLLGNFWICVNHTQPITLPVTEQPTHPLLPRGERLVPLIPKLPSTIALTLDEYTREDDDYQALHIMCGTLEITARFLTVIALADVWERRVSPDGDFPDGLLKHLLQHLERPTLGSWRVLLEEAINALPGKKKRKECLLPGLPDYAKKFTGELGGGKANPLEKLLPMRNELAHGGRISDDRVKEFLEAHTDRFDDLMNGLEFLSEDAEVALVASPAEEPALLLRGLPATKTEFDRSQLPEGFQQAGPDRMLLVTPQGVLDLCPLHAFGEVFQIEKDQLVSQEEEAIHIYSRTAGAAGVEYTALGSRASNSRGVPSWEERFAELFRFEAWRSRYRIEGALARYTFNRRMDDLLKLFIGRDKQVAAATARIDALDSGILWLEGKPGMGKSAFMAKLVRDHFQRDAETGESRMNLICIPYFFQASDGDRCRTASFAEAAILRLAQATGQDIKVKAEPEERVKQFKDVLNSASTAEGGNRKIVFFVDGIDEIADVNADFVDLIFECQHSSVLWVCAGRDEELLSQRFSRDNCQWFFEQDSKFDSLCVERKEDEALLPPLNADGVRGYFIEELGHRLPQFFGRDKKDGDEWSNEFVEEVIRRSDGLPLYLILLVQDIRAGRIDFLPGSELRLPCKLDDYYDRIVKEMGDDLAATVPAITSLLALAKEPLPFETLAALLADHELVAQADGGELLEDALRHSSIMLRRAPTATGALGYELYHASFRQHLQKSDRIRRSRTKALDRLCSLASNWCNYKRGSLPLDHALRFGPSYLTKAGGWDELKTILTDFSFLNAKTKAMDPQPLIQDYDLTQNSEMPLSAQDSHNLSMIQGAIRLSAHILAQDGTQLAGQLIGRLLSHESQVIQDMLEQAAGSMDIPWLRPLTSTLTSPGGALLRTMSGHTSDVNSVAVTPNGRYAISGSEDKTLKVWDLETGAEVRTLSSLWILPINCRILPINCR